MPLDRTTARSVAGCCALVVALSAACAETSPPAAPESPGTRSIENPADFRPPPRAVLHGTPPATGVVVYEQQLANGQVLAESEAESVPDDLAAATLRSRQELALEIDAARLPVTVDVLLYDGELTSDGLPAGEPERLECRPPGEAASCAYRHDCPRRYLRHRRHHHRHRLRVR